MSGHRTPQPRLIPNVCMTVKFPTIKVNFKVSSPIPLWCAKEWTCHLLIAMVISRNRDECGCAVALNDELDVLKISSIWDYLGSAAASATPPSLPLHVALLLSGRRVVICTVSSWWWW